MSEWIIPIIALIIGIFLGADWKFRRKGKPRTEISIEGYQWTTRLEGAFFAPGDGVLLNVKIGDHEIAQAQIQFTEEWRGTFLFHIWAEGAEFRAKVTFPDESVRFYRPEKDGEPWVHVA